MTDVPETIFQIWRRHPDGRFFHFTFYDERTSNLQNRTASFLFFTLLYSSFLFPFFLPSFFFPLLFCLLSLSSPKTKCRYRYILLLLLLPYRSEAASIFLFRHFYRSHKMKTYVCNEKKNHFALPTKKKQSHSSQSS